MSFFNQKDIAILVAINERGVFIIDHVNGVREKKTIFFAFTKSWNNNNIHALDSAVGIKIRRAIMGIREIQFNGRPRLSTLCIYSGTD